MLGPFHEAEMISYIVGISTNFLMALVMKYMVTSIAELAVQWDYL